MPNPPVVNNPALIGVDAHNADGIAGQAPQFASDGNSFVAQYIDKYSDASSAGYASLSHNDVLSDTAANLSIVSIFQTNGMSSSSGTAYQSYFTTSQGTADAKEALQSAMDLEQPAGSTIYFACDFNPAIYGTAGSETALLQQVQTYFTAVSQQFAGTGYNIGVYGAGDTLAAVIRNQYAADPTGAATTLTTGYTPVGTQGWLTQSYGWAGSASGDTNAAGWQIYQQYYEPNNPNSNGSTYENGINVDDDDATTTALGQWTCFATGTLIRTARGDVAVEALAVGDLAVTASGERRPIRWIGQRTLRCRNLPTRKVWPFRVTAGALGTGLPERDLWLSPEHAVCVGDVLVPVRALAQPGLVDQVEVDEITYWHVELDSHDILLANGAPAESYLDTGNRGFFEADGPAELRREPPAAAGFCRPFVESGEALSEIRVRLFGTATPAPEPEVATLHLVADDTVLLPHRAGDTATFIVPATTRELRLSSPRFTPVGRDVRTLGVLVSSITLEIGDKVRAIPLDDPALFAGFHDVERSADATWRWTNGDGHIASDLWAGATGAVQLRVTGMLEPSAKGQLAA